ncbi:hypothetical protein [Arthrobacter sp. N1]|uniref:hypothetical protein n=1 Tax=Arthrobacter sp. N1 TaxID=619291 RepID=UPI003BB1F75C
MTSLKLAQIILLLAALVSGATAPIHNGQTMLAFVLLGGVLLIARLGRQAAPVETAR